MKAAILILAVVLISACDGNATTNTSTNTTTCSYTYSGALTGTFSSSCVGGIAGYNSNTGQAGVTFPNVTSNTYQVAGAISLVSQGGISNKTYSISDNSAQGGFVIINPSNNQTWEAATASGSNPATGSFSINITSNSQYGSASGVTGYYIHGTADGTLTAVTGTGATGTVTLHAVF